MDRPQIASDPSAVRLRRVGRLARRRMRIDASELRNGFHSDGTVTVEISGLGAPAAGVPDSFEWVADRPIALLVVRSGIDGEDVAFQVSPGHRGTGRGAALGDGTGIRSVAFCYDAPVPTESAHIADGPMAAATTDRSPSASPARRRLAAASAFAPTGRDRRSILGLLQRPAIRPATT